MSLSPSLSALKVPLIQPFTDIVSTFFLVPPQVMTVGVLIQRLHHDPGLRNIGIVVFDEFHERNLDR